MHKPVLAKEALEFLNPQPGEFFIDGTVGNAGHAALILESILPQGIILAVDWDVQAISDLESKISSNNVIFVCDNYANIPKIIEEKKFPKADGLIIDLGFSSDQLEGAGRGFSFLKNDPLDMRYNTDNGYQTAAEIINSSGEKYLADIFWKYGEERYSRRIARKIIESRRKRRILTTSDLVEIIREAVPGNYERGRIHPATRAFQALRICVNRELENLETLLGNLSAVVKPGGRAAIISFHSLEDRLVKNYFRQMAKSGQANILTKKPIIADREEMQNNPRSRSAKLRAVKLI